jgi:hypothetical protein
MTKRKLTIGLGAIALVLTLFASACTNISEYDKCISKCRKDYSVLRGVEDPRASLSDQDYAAYKARLRAAELVFCPERCEPYKEE